MIKIGCCLSMNAAVEPKTGAETIPLVQNLGFDYLELPLAQIMELSKSGFEELLGKVRSGGIPAEACNNFFPANLRLTGEEARPDEALEYTRAAVERAATLGVKIIVLGSSGAKNIPHGFPCEKAREQFLQFLKGLENIVKAYNITVVLEPLNSKESNFITTAGEALKIVREIASDHIKLLIDYYHLRMENEDPAVIKTAGSDLRHLHIASKEGRLFPRSNDGEDYADFFGFLQSSKYNGRISVEAFTNNISVDGSAALKLLRPLAV